MKYLFSKIKSTFSFSGTTRGFTLVEAMVAISILSISVTAPLFIAQKGIGSAIYAKDQITAFYLAQEGVEYIRNARDTNRISGAASWLTGLDECIDTGAGEKCTIDVRYSNPFDVDAIKSCPLSGCPILSIDTSEGIYGYGSGWTPTKFTRTISMESAPGSIEALIAVTISWNTNLFAPTRKFTVREYIFNY